MWRVAQMVRDKLLMCHPFEHVLPVKAYWRILWSQNTSGNFPVDRQEQKERIRWREESFKCFQLLYIHMAYRYPHKRGEFGETLLADDVPRNCGDCHMLAFCPLQLDSPIAAGSSCSQMPQSGPHLTILCDKNSTTSKKVKERQDWVQPTVCSLRDYVIPGISHSNVDDVCGARLRVMLRLLYMNDSKWHAVVVCTSDGLIYWIFNFRFATSSCVNACPVTSWNFPICIQDKFWLRKKLIIRPKEFLSFRRQSFEIQHRREVWSSSQSCFIDCCSGRH